MVLASSSGALNEVVRPGSTLSLSDAQLESRIRTLFFGAQRGRDLITAGVRGGRRSCVASAVRVCPAEPAVDGTAAESEILSESGDKVGPETQPRDPPLLVPSLPQEQGLKANNSKELSMCFTEVSEGQSGGGCRGLCGEGGCLLGEPWAWSPQIP